MPGVNEVVDERRATDSTSRIREAMFLYVALLPVAAVVTFYLLVADRFTASSADDLARASYGWPFDWVQQDLSRYDPIGFPTTIDFSWQRAWHDPIVTTYDWFAFAANTLIVGVVVAGIVGFVIAAVRRSRKARQQ
ncbi:hypothetical protein MN032_11970 [Agromyces atrinae]|uniref:hypothetical protein n=1 Tax=Agromyces atrinae TaxID=592376 RepID=UPI001F5AAC77|nr:hypothetical protein [Agromyces atrinae]MCI2958411.1 hypothetical protein [Agromyces atrinae]